MTSQARFARDVMSEDVITACTTDSVQDVARLLCDRRIGGVPVLDEDGHLVGILTEDDLIVRVAGPHVPAHVELLGGIIYLERPHEIQENLRKSMGMTVEEVMTREVVTVDDDCPLRDVAELMLTKRVNRVPVMREGALVGIITRHDLVSTLR